MLFKNITPAKIISLAFEQYIKTHTDESLLNVLEDRKFDYIRSKASGFAIKEYLQLAVKENNLSYECVDGSLVFYKYSNRLCSLSSELTDTISMADDGNKVKVYRGNKMVLRTYLGNEGKESFLMKIYSLTLLLSHNPIVESIKLAGLSNDIQNYEQIAFIA